MINLGRDKDLTDDNEIIICKISISSQIENDVMS